MPKPPAQEAIVRGCVDGAWMLVLDLRCPVAEDKPSRGERVASWGLGDTGWLFLNSKKSNDSKYKPSLPVTMNIFVKARGKKI